jgi:hypothetical protein
MAEGDVFRMTEVSGRSTGPASHQPENEAVGVGFEPTRGLPP